MSMYPITQNAALLVIDVQKEYSASGRPMEIPDAVGVVSTIGKLIHAARDCGLTVIFIQHVHRADLSDIGRMMDFSDNEVFIEGTPEVELTDAIPVANTDLIVKKTRYSAFCNTELESILKTKAIDTLIIAGFMTNFCCESTARDAHDRDYKVIVVSDAIAAPPLPDLGFGPVNMAEIQKVTLTTLAAGFARIARSTEILQEFQQLTVKEVSQ